MSNSILRETCAAFESNRLARDEFWQQMQTFHHALADYSNLVGRGELASIEIHPTGLVVVLNDGVRMSWRPEDTRSVPSVMVNHGSYEPREVAALCALAERAEVILDIGANAGFMALKLARAAKSVAARVHAFEPVPSTYVELEHNVQLNRLSGRIRRHNLALGEAPGSVPFFVPAFHGSVAASMRPLFPGAQREVVVTMSTLDTFVGEQKLTRVDLIKCDVEGAELFALRGGLETIKKFRPVLMLEMLRKWARAFGYHPNDILALLLPLGYRCFSLASGVLNEHEQIDDRTAATNFFLLDPEHHAVELARLRDVARAEEQVAEPATQRDLDTGSRAMARRVRADVLRMVHRAKASHVGSCLSCVDVLAVLYHSVLRVDPQDPQAERRDRFIMSKGHAAAALYATLADAGFFPSERLTTFCEDGSSLAGHVVHKGVAGVEVSTGSLGHGLSLGAGMALAARGTTDPYRVFVLLSDGECDEGSVWEAALFAAHQRLENLVVVVDRNQLQGFGRVEDVMDLEPFPDKWRAFGWHVEELDGHDHAQLRKTLSSTPRAPGKPTLVIARTVKGKGVRFMEDQMLWHYRSPNEAELVRALAELEAGEAT